MGKENHRMCDEDCNNCEVVENKRLAVLLNTLALVYGEGVWQITNTVCPNMTVCPNCGIDDFCHWSDDDIGVKAIDNIEKEGGLHCEIAAKAIEIAREFRAKCNKSKMIKADIRSIGAQKHEECHKMILYHLGCLNNSVRDFLKQKNRLRDELMVEHCLGLLVHYAHKKPPEEDAESLVRHRNRATPLDKNPKNC